MQHSPRGRDALATRPTLTPQVSLRSATRKHHQGAGDDARLLPRHRADTPSLDRRRLERAQAHALLETLQTNTSDALPLRHELTKPGDADQLRGIPAIGRSVAGAIPGTNPLSETIKRLTRAEHIRQATAT